MEQQILIPLSPPPSPATPTKQKIYGSPAKAKTCHFPILDLKWGWVQDCSFTVLIIFAVFWSSDSTFPLTYPHPIRERTTGQNRRSETTYIIYWRKKMPFCVMLAAEKQHFTWFKFPLRVNTAKGEMCHLSWADKGSKQNLQRGHHHPLFWPWTGMCFRKTCKTCSVFCSLEKNNERTLEGHIWEECTNSFQ